MIILVSTFYIVASVGILHNYCHGMQSKNYATMTIMHTNDKTTRLTGFLGATQDDHVVDKDQPLPNKHPLPS